MTRASEMLWTSNVSSEVPPYFPVLVRSSQDSFAVERLASLSPQSKLVTQVKDQDLDEISRDLRSSVSDHSSNYAYFQIVGRGQGYTDVSLEVPTIADFWPKGWYRIEKGSAHPQRIIFYGPMLGIVGFILPVAPAIIAVLFYNKISCYRGAKLVAPAVSAS